MREMSSICVLEREQTEKRERGGARQEEAEREQHLTHTRAISGGALVGP